MTSTNGIQRNEAFHQVTDILRCKWTIAVLDAIDRGVCRPAQIQREYTGLSSKVLHDRLNKLERFGLVNKESYPETPPRVEYAFSARGNDLVELVRSIRVFAEDWQEE